MASFQGAGQVAGLEIWRIENLQAVRYPQENYGKFYSGDSYLILKTNAERGGRLSWDLHFWLGNNSSQDEMGVAAYKTVELDDLLGGGPVQHREVQGHESALFLSYFKGGIQYLDGGVDSGFNHVDPDAYEPRLFHLKGKRNVRVQQVEKSVTSLNDGDVFILDLGLKIFQWNGRQANKFEKFKGLEMTQKIKDQERGGRPTVIFLESGQADPQGEEFWKHLGGGPDQVASADAGGSDDEQKSVETTLYRVQNGASTLVASGRTLRQDALATEGVFLLDSGSEVFVWLGKQSDREERKQGMILAQNYLTSHNRPAWTPITRLLETGETPVFKSYFATWATPKAAPRHAAPAAAAAAPRAAPAQEAKADCSALYQRQQGGADDMVDDGSGELTVWRVENFQKVPIAPETYGQFYSGDSYVCLYKFMRRNRANYIIYFWQGVDSSSDEKGASALLAVDLDDSLGGEPTQVRVTQGKEPNHFLQLFRGKMIVHRGGVASGFKNARGETVGASRTSLYHVRGSNALNTRALQVNEVASSLNSGDTFVLLTEAHQYVWFGQHSNDEERQVARNVAAVLKGNRASSEVTEGNEPAAFWDALGGRAEYTTYKNLEGEPKEPRLFHCSNATGRFKIEEVFNFTQDDLISDDIMILDLFTEVYVWVGKESNKQEKDQAFQAALDYVANAPDGRDRDCPVFRVEEGSEPPSFTSNFLGWKERAVFEDIYAKRLRELRGEAVEEHKAPAISRAVTRVAASDIGMLDWNTHHFSLAQLRDRENPPANIDMTQKELYLSDADFQGLFKMSKQQFLGLKAWQRQQEKKKHNLF